MSVTTELPTKQFGKTDMNITHVGFGSWAVGGDWAVGWGNQDDRESIDAIRHAPRPVAIQTVNATNRARRAALPGPMVSAYDDARGWLGL